MQTTAQFLRNARQSKLEALVWKTLCQRNPSNENAVGDFVRALLAAGQKEEAQAQLQKLAWRAMWSESAAVVRAK